jgi:hypothetical protein
MDTIRGEGFRLIRPDYCELRNDGVTMFPHSLLVHTEKKMEDMISVVALHYEKQPQQIFGLSSQ